MKHNSPIISKHGGYRNLKSFQIAQLVYDLTVRFCERYIPRSSRTNDQMVQAARSGVQNIAEGSQGSATSRKFELKLTQVARASLEELKLDYQDFLRQRGSSQWPKAHHQRMALVDARFQTEKEVAGWVQRQARLAKMEGQTVHYSELAARVILVYIEVACFLLDRQIKSLADRFEKEGSFSERLYRARKNNPG